MAEAGFPPSLRLLVRQIGYQNRTFRRTPIAVFFTLALPLIMLVLFNALFGSADVETPYGAWPLSQFYTGALAAFTAVSATFTNLANIVPIRRDEGVLKRWRGTSLPPWVYFGGLIGAAIAARRRRRGDHADARRRRLRPRHRGRQGAGRRRHVPRRRGVVRRPRHGRRRPVPVGVGGVRRRQRDHPADGVHLRHLHPPRGPAGVARHARRRAAAEAVRPELPGHPQPGACRRRRSTGTSSPSSRHGVSPGSSLRCGRSGGSLPAAARPMRRRARAAAADQAPPEGSGGRDASGTDRGARGAAGKVVREFVTAEIEPHAEAWDRDHTFPVETVLAMGELGLFGIPFPEPYGGGRRPHRAVRRDRGDRPRRPVAGDHAGGRRRPRRQPDPQVRHTRTSRSAGCPTSAPGGRSAGSGSPSPTPEATPVARARRPRLDEAAGEWVIDGEKAFITNSGHADHVDRHDHRADRAGRDLHHRRAGRHARLGGPAALPQDGLARIRHPRADVRRVPRARGSPARPARAGVRPVPRDPRRGPHRHRRPARSA